MSHLQPEHNPPSRLPTTDQWIARVRYGLRALVRDAERIRSLVLAQAPENTGKPHLDFLLRPSNVGPLGDATRAIADALYQLEVQARYHRHRPADIEQIHIARQHIAQGAIRLRQLAHREGP